MGYLFFYYVLMRFKSIVAILLACMLSFSIANAQTVAPNDWDDTPEYREVQYFDHNFEVEIEKLNGTVYASWNDFPDGEGFLWYKLLYSTTVSEPVYPNQWAVFVGTARGQTEAKFRLKSSETHYLRLCVVTKEDDGVKGRYCSKVEKIHLDDEDREDDEDRSVACTREYVPVCGSRNGKQYTFSNKCTLKAEEARYLYSGKCKVVEDEDDEVRPVACTKEYAPVCGKKNGDKQTFWNKCMMKAENASYLYSGRCAWNNDTTHDDDDKYDEDDNSNDYGLSDQMQDKIDDLLENFIKKLESKDYSDAKIVSTIDQIIVKLKRLKNTPKYKALVSYMIDVLQEYKEEYEDDFGIIKDIFSDY